MNKIMKTPPHALHLKNERENNNTCITRGIVRFHHVKKFTPSLEP